MRGEALATSSGFSSRLAWGCQLLLRPSDWPVLCCGCGPYEFWDELPQLLPPDSTTMVSSPSRVLTYSAVVGSLTPKNTCVVLARSV